MRNRAMLAFVAATAFVVGECSAADFDRLTVRNPGECPAGLEIKSKVAKDGMLLVDLDVDSEEITRAGDLYKGRTKAQAYLKLATADQQLAYVKVEGTTEGSRTRFHFQISPSVANTSELHLGVHLYEADGRPTLGGGASIVVHLAGFTPKK